MSIKQIERPNRTNLMLAKKECSIAKKFGNPAGSELIRRIKEFSMISHSPATTPNIAQLYPKHRFFECFGKNLPKKIPIEKIKRE